MHTLGTLSEQISELSRQVWIVDRWDEPGFDDGRTNGREVRREVKAGSNGEDVVRNPERSAGEVAALVH